MHVGTAGSTARDEASSTSAAFCTSKALNMKSRNRTMKVTNVEVLAARHDVADGKARQLGMSSV